MKHIQPIGSALLIFVLLTGCAPRIITTLPMSPVGKFIYALKNDPDQSRANWGIYAVNLSTGEILADYNADNFYAPASNTKLYTSSAILNILEDDFRYVTPIMTTGPIINGTLEGDLVVVGVGDPSWSARMREGDGTTVFVGWVDSLKARGITKIDGNIIGIDGVYDGVPFGAGWMWDDEPFWHGAAISALMFNDNLVDITVIPKPGDRPTLILNPDTDYLTVINNLVTLDTLNNPDSLTVDRDISRQRGTNIGRLDGISSPDTSEAAITIENPPAFAATVLMEVLRANGVTVTGHAEGHNRFDAHREPLDLPTDTLFTFASPPLSEIIWYLNKDSQNLIAENLLRTPAIGAEGGASAKRGLELFRPVWAMMGLDTNGVDIRDGSGVSHYTRVTPRNTAAILEYMHGDTTFFNSLPIAGIDGTLESRMTVPAVTTGWIHAKTGELTQANALSGYLIQTSGDTVAFSILVNDYMSSRWAVKMWTDRLLGVILTQ